MTFDDLCQCIGGGRPSLSWGRAYPSTNDMNPLVTADELCLLKAGKTCGKCIKTCPIQILSEDGVNRPRCYARLRENYHLLMEPDGLPDPPAGSSSPFCTHPAFV